MNYLPRRVTFSAIAFAALSLSGIWLFHTAVLGTLLMVAGVAHLFLVASSFNHVVRRLVALQYLLAAVALLAIVVHLLRELWPVGMFWPHLADAWNEWTRASAPRRLLVYAASVIGGSGVVLLASRRFPVRRPLRLSNWFVTLFTASTLSVACEFALRRRTFWVSTYYPADFNDFAFAAGLELLDFVILFHVCLLLAALGGALLPRTRELLFQAPVDSR